MGLSITVPTCTGARSRSSSTRRPLRGARTGPRCSDPGPDGEKGGGEGTGHSPGLELLAEGCRVRDVGCSGHPPAACTPSSLSLLTFCLAVPPPRLAQPQRQQPESLLNFFLGPSGISLGSQGRV